LGTLIQDESRKKATKSGTPLPDNNVGAHDIFVGLMRFPEKI